VCSCRAGGTATAAAAGIYGAATIGTSNRQSCCVSASEPASAFGLAPTADHAHVPAASCAARSPDVYPPAPSSQSPRRHVVAPGRHRDTIWVIDGCLCTPSPFMHVAPLAAAVDARRAARSCSRCTYNAPSSVDNEPYYTTTHLLMKITAPPRHDPCYHPPQAPADCLKSRAQAPKGGALSLKPLRDARRSESRTPKPSFGAEASFESKALSLEPLWSPSVLEQHDAVQSRAWRCSTDEQQAD